MNELLLRLSDEDLSKVGRLRQEIAALAKKHIEQEKQIAALEQQNSNLRNGNDELICELRVAEADFRIQQNLINDLYNMTEEKLFRSGPRISRPYHSTFSTPVSVSARAHVPETRVEPAHWPVKSEPAVLPVPPASVRHSQIVEIRAPVSSGSSRRTGSSTSTTQPQQPPRSAPPLATTTQPPMPVPEPMKKTEKLLSEIEQKALTNALRRQALRKPVCWLFKTGTCDFGDKCAESHDTIPFMYCRAYNDTGLCNAPRCDQKHVLFDYEKMVRDASKTPQPRPVNPENAADAAKARELNLEEWERMDKLRKEKDIGGRRRYFSEASASSGSTSAAAAPVVSVPAPTPVVSSRDWQSDAPRGEREDRSRDDDRGEIHSDRLGSDRGAAHYDRDKSLDKVSDRYNSDSTRRGRGGVECADGFVRGGGNIRDTERILSPPTGAANGRNRF